MDSYNIHFEKMSNFDLHPLSRHSPSKSTSSIDQCTHHHGKGDSAYSSFSGGSTAPDYPSPFLTDDLHPHELQYADLKYVKAVYGPSILDSDSKHTNLYSSMELHQHHQTHNGYSNVKDPPVPTTYLPPPPPPPPSSSPLPSTPPLPPPPPPVHSDSFITARNPETSSFDSQHSGVSPFRHQTSNSEILSSRPNLVYDLWVPQNYERKQDFLENPSESKSESAFNRLPLQTWQPEHLHPNMVRQSEVQHSRSHSACEAMVSEQQHTINSRHMAQNTISGSIQHKGQFYFITGVCKPCESSVTPPLPPLPPPPPQYPSDRNDNHSQAELQRSHNTVENMFKNIPLRKQSCGEIVFQEKKVSTQNEEEEPSSSHQSSKSQSVTDTGVMNRNHTNTHPIFYCGPEEHFSSSSQHKPVTSVSNDVNHDIHFKHEEPAKKPTRKYVADMPTQKISKETTPLLYQLTGASRMTAMKSMKNEKNTSLGCKSDWCKDHQESGQDSVSFSGHSLHSESPEEAKSNEFYYLCNTMDDSFKKYYKDKLKNAQSKVLRETSFKRKDLSLSWQKVIQQCCDKKLPVVPSAPHVQENHNPAHLQTLQNTDTVNSHETKKDVVKQQNFAQPQVPRVGGRKRLTLEQKKLSNSEPEKLHRLGDGPIHVTCRSLGSESEGLLSEEHLGPHGLVAVRRKMFEMRGRAMSACSFSKSTLKHLQQKALVAYMERKTGFKIAEPQQPAPQVPSPGTHFDLGPKPNSGPKEKPLRPLSASRIHDSISIRCSQFTSGHHSGHSRRSSWKEQQSPPSVSSSVEDLLEDEQQAHSYKNCSTSTLHSFHQNQKHLNSTTHKDGARAEIGMEGERKTCKEYATSFPDQQKVRTLASRRKSMEELLMSSVSRPKVLSKSSDQLNHIKGTHVLPAGEKRDDTKQHSAPLLHSKENIQNFKEPGPVEHTSTLGNSGTRRSSVEGKVTAVAGSPRGASETASKIKAVPQEVCDVTYVKKGEVSHGDERDVHSIHEVSLGYGVTTDLSLWNLLPETGDAETPESTINHPTLSHHPQRKDSVSGCEQLTALPVPAPDGAQERKRNIERKCPVDQPQWETLVQEVVSTDQSLARILYPVANRKTAVMLMEQMLSEDNLLMEDHYKKKQEKQVTTPEQMMCSDIAEDDDVNVSSAMSDVTFCWSNQHRAQLSSGANVTEKKRQLMAHIEEQLRSLEGLRSSLQDEEKEIGLLGNSLELLVRENCLPAELERYTQFIEDLERVISLLLCLSARLARVQNALSTVDENTDPEEKESLLSRHHLLCKQREDAKDLKENLDRRERMVSTFLAKQLTEEKLQEYRCFVQSKASLLIRQKDLDEKQRLGEEQLEALLNTIPP